MKSYSYESEIVRSEGSAFAFAKLKSQIQKSGAWFLGFSSAALNWILVRPEIYIQKAPGQWTTREQEFNSIQEKTCAESFFRIQI